MIEAIHGGNVGAIAVAYVEFASSFEVRTVLDWRLSAIRRRRRSSSTGWLQHLAHSGAAPRSAAGIDRAVQLLAESGFETQRRVIDVCGDGTNNAGRDVD